MHLAAHHRLVLFSAKLNIKQPYNFTFGAFQVLSSCIHGCEQSTEQSQHVGITGLPLPSTTQPSELCYSNPHSLLTAGICF